MRTEHAVAVKLIPRLGPGAPTFDAEHITRELLNHRMVRECHFPAVLLSCYDATVPVLLRQRACSSIALPHCATTMPCRVTNYQSPCADKATI